MGWTSRRSDVPPANGVDAGEPPDDLTGVVASGVLWKALTRGTSEATRLVVVLVLARLLTPADYGVAGMALVVAAFGLLLTDPALGAALIQRPTIDERDRSTVFWLTVGLGAALTLLGVASAGLVAGFFGEPEVRGLFAAASLSFVVVAAGVAPRALLTRRLAYRELELRQMASVVVGGAVAVAVAFAGFGPWAVISNLLAYALVSTALAWLLVGWRPRATFSRASARNLGGFSARVFGASLLGWGDQNVDKGLIGRVVGAAALGSYTLAWNVMLMPVQLVSETVNQALNPAYSRIQRDRERLERVWLANKRLSFALVAPSLAVVAVEAPDLVEVVFGEKWDDAVVPLQLLCLGAIARALGGLHWPLLQARGEGGALLRITILISAVTWAAFAVGLHWGIVGVAAGYACAKWLLVVPTSYLTARAVGFDFWASLRAGTVILPLAAASAAVGLLARHLLVAAGTPAAPQLLLVASVMLVVYLGLVLLVIPSLAREVRVVVARLRARSGSSPAAQSGTP